MGDVLSNLVVALQLQENSTDNGNYAEETSSIAKTQMVSTNPSTDSTMSIAGQGFVFSGITDAEGH